MFSFRKTNFLVLLALCLGILSACGDDDDNMMMICPPPMDAFVLSDCLMDIPDMLRPADDPDVTFEVNLFLDNGDYLYAFISSSIVAPIEVFDACCNNICRIGFPETTACTFQDTAEDLGIIFSE